MYIETVVMERWERKDVSATLDAALAHLVLPQITEGWKCVLK